ncbi:MAG: 50S ribosomal protein L15 [Rickettsiales bacterium]|nr:50S ribosomal protein L15 [Rickettsiales bacterium]|tara:strand:+ start:261 stop:749 length:489 start_codon:yes stop_codon:yes gene_type:complete
MELKDIQDNNGARKSRMRVGRGIGSGKGKTCGRGHKGQTSRSGVAIKGFEGGQMPIYRRLPKRGFTNLFRTDYQVVNLQAVAQAVSDKKLKAGAIDRAALVEAGLVRDNAQPVKLLGNLGETKLDKLSITVDKASKSAVEQVEKAGGSVTVAQSAKPAVDAE